MARTRRQGQAPPGDRSGEPDPSPTSTTTQKQSKRGRKPSTKAAAATTKKVPKKRAKKSHNPVPPRDPSPALPTDRIEHEAFQRVGDLLNSNEIEQPPPSSPPPPVTVEISSLWSVSLEGLRNPLRVQICVGLEMIRHITPLWSG
jgi:hypothetical protein